MEPPRGLRHQLVGLLVVAASVASIAGLALLWIGMDQLRVAHLYRQRTGEGLRFVWTAAQLVIATCVAMFGAAGFGLAAFFTRPTARFALAGAALAITAIVMLCAVLALWVESHGSRCIGPCG